MVAPPSTRWIFRGKPRHTSSSYTFRPLPRVRAIVFLPPCDTSWSGCNKPPRIWRTAASPTCPPAHHIQGGGGSPRCALRGPRRETVGAHQQIHLAVVNATLSLPSPLPFECPPRRLLPVILVLRRPPPGLERRPRADEV